MKNLLTCTLVILCTLGFVTAQPLTSTAPNGSFTASEIEYWIGEGDNEAALVLVFNDGLEGVGNAMVWGYRWTGSKTWWGMICDITNIDPRFFAMQGSGGTVGGYGFDVNENGVFFITQPDGTTLYPDDNNLFIVGGYDYDEWSAGEEDDRWVSGWGLLYWFLDPFIGYEGEISGNSWYGATATDFSGEILPLSETLQSATYSPVLPPTSDICESPSIINTTVNNENSSITITWNNVATANSYHLYRNETLIAENQIATTYLDTELEDGNYCYTVVSVCENGVSYPSVPSCADISGEICQVPNSVTAEANNDNIFLTWSNVTSAVGYNIYREGVLIVENHTATTYVDNDLMDGTHCYAVVSVCSNGVSEASEQTCATVSTISFPPAAGQEGSTAIAANSSLFVGWATGIQLTRGYTDIATPSAFTSFGYPAQGLGVAEGGSMDVVSLGDAGEAILTFDRPIVNGEGFDFAVFENSFDDYFLELGFVEVSSDGERFVRFPSYSLTPTDVQVGGFGSVDATKIHNLAGKYRQGYGTPFDLQDLADSTNIDLNNIRFVKIIDAIGTIDPMYATYDCQGHMVNDPYPTNFNSGGFDLDGVGIINAGEPYSISNFNDLTLAENSYWNGSDGSGSFQSGNVQYTNNYDYYSWVGFSYSNMTDNTTSGYENQFSAYTRGGMDANETGTNYAIGFVGTNWEAGIYDPVPITASIATNEAQTINGFYVTNSTYAYLSMLNGDSFAKKFGGTSGNDPDWFKLMIYGIDAANNSTDTIEFYLADFRFEDNANDYIVANWRWVETSSLGPVKSLKFYLLSSDAGAYGINTPSYFCMDNLYIQVEEIEDHPPYVNQPIANITVEENATDYTIDLNDVFVDPDGDEITITVASNSNESLVSTTLSNNQLILSFTEDMNGETEIELMATANGQTATDAFIVTVTPTPDNPPVVIHPIDDVTVEENAEDYNIDLSNVFSDTDGDTIILSVLANSNLELLTATISETILTLSFSPETTGTATIVIQATANGVNITDAFLVTVTPAPDQPPVVINPVEDVIVDENSNDIDIDLSDVFSDPDGDEITITVQSNSNETLVQTSITNQILTLSFTSETHGEAVIVLMANADGQSVTDEFTVTVNPNNNINESENIAFNIYPNPCHNIISINADNQPETIELYDISGHLVYKNSNISENPSVNMTPFPLGMYIIKIYCKNNVSSQMIIKQ